MANLEWLLCLLRVAMYCDAHACNDVTDTSTEYSSFTIKRMARGRMHIILSRCDVITIKKFTVEVV